MKKISIYKKHRVLLALALSSIIVLSSCDDFFFKTSNREVSVSSSAVFVFQNISPELTFHILLLDQDSGLNQDFTFPINDVVVLPNTIVELPIEWTDKVDVKTKTGFLFFGDTGSDDELKRKIKKEGAFGAYISDEDTNVRIKELGMFISDGETMTVSFDGTIAILIE